MTHFETTDCTVFGGSLVEQVVDVPHLPGTGQANVPLTGMATLPGGSGGNVAVYMGRLGCSVRLIDRWGDDQHAEFLEERMKAEGVELTQVQRVPEMPTPFMIILTLPEGDWSGITRLPDLACIGPDDFDADAVGRSQFLHLQSFNMSTDRGKAGSSRAAEEANKAGVPISLDACTPVAVSDPDAILSLVPYCDIFFANEREAEALTGCKDIGSAANALLDFGASRVVIKAGDSGCHVLSSGSNRMFHVPAHSVAVSDTIGAGDGVVAGTLFGLVHGLDLNESVRLGVSVASLVCEGRGAQSRKFTAREVIKLAGVKAPLSAAGTRS